MLPFPRPLPRYQRRADRARQRHPGHVVAHPPSLLRDVAASKGMSVDSALEEILLHTNEPFRGGVASPHTRKTLAYIQELKAKHGIDYDSHASYRFVERP